MKYKLSFALIILTIFILTPANATVKTANLVAAWRFEGNANDWAGNARKALSFDGVNNYINLGASLNGLVAPLTYSF